MALSFVWFCSRLSPGVAFGTWQGPLLTDAPYESIPIISKWVAGIAALAPWGNAAWRVNIVSALAGAGACGMVAVVATTVSKRYATRLEACLCGLLAATFLALTPRMTYECTAASPAPLTLFLAVTSILCLRCAWGGEGNALCLSVAAFLAGVSAANHPSFALLIPLLLVGAASRSSDGHGLAANTALVVATFTVGAILPFMASLREGESCREFLAHALVTPYPAVGEAAPALGFLRNLTGQLPAAMLAVAPAAIPLLFMQQTRVALLLWGVVFLMFGPFLPALTNQYGVDVSLRDSAAPALIVLAGSSLFTAFGVSVAAQALSLGRARALVYVSAILVGVAVLLPGAPHRGHTMAARLGEAVLESCPPEAILLSDEPALASLLLTTQAIHASRRDVRIAPAHALVAAPLRGRLREKLAEGPGKGVAMTRSFPPLGALERWEEERPGLWRELLDAEGSDAGEASAHALGPNPFLRDLAVWDFLRDNSTRRTVCFVGFSQDWLAARLHPSGALLMYPWEFPDGSPAQPGAGDAAKLVDQCRAVQHHPMKDRDIGMTRTLRHLLLPMSANARKQDRIDSARQLAGLAVQLTPGDAASRLALARAEARAGNATEASVHGEIYLRIADTRAETEDGQQSGPAAVDLLKRDLEACYAAQRFGDLAASPLEVNLESDAWGSAEKTLWQEHELVALERGYERFLTGAPKDADALYQYAAVLVQLGALSRGREALLDAVELAPVNVLRNLRRDGRFVQLPEAQRSQDRV